VVRGKERSQWYPPKGGKKKKAKKEGKESNLRTQINKEKKKKMSSTLRKAVADHVRGGEKKKRKLEEGGKKKKRAKRPPIPVWTKGKRKGGGKRGRFRCAGEKGTKEQRRRGRERRLCTGIARGKKRGKRATAGFAGG